MQIVNKLETSIELFIRSITLIFNQTKISDSQSFCRVTQSDSRFYRSRRYTRTRSVIRKLPMQSYFSTSNLSHLIYIACFAYDYRRKEYAVLKQIKPRRREKKTKQNSKNLRNGTWMDWSGGVFIVRCLISYTSMVKDQRGNLEAVDFPAFDAGMPRRIRRGRAKGESISERMMKWL